MAQVLQLLEQRLLTWALDRDAFGLVLRQSFGVQANTTAAETLRATLLGEGLGVELAVQPLPGLRGAYAAASGSAPELVLLDGDWLARASAEEVEAVLLEEIGHAIDQRLNGPIDSPGDEGELFSALLRGVKPSANSGSENDQRWIEIDGASRLVEAAAATKAPQVSLGGARNPAFAGPSLFLPDVGYMARPTFADIDGDGDLDAFVGERDGSTIFFRNTGSASAAAFAASTASGLPDVGTYAFPTLADIDSDGDLEALIGSDTGATSFYRNSGNATAPSFWPATAPSGLTGVGTYASPTLADIDADGDLDAFIGNGAGNTTFFRNTGSRTNPSFSVVSLLPNVGTYARPSFADIDADGDLDAFIGNGDGSTIFFRNTGTRTSPAFSSSSIGFGFPDVGQLASPTFADIDADGDLDAFIGNRDGNTLFFRNSGTDGLTSSNSSGAYLAGGVITILVPFTDVVTVNTSGGTPTLLLETGTIDRKATYISGSGTNILSFRYTVVVGDASLDLDTASVTALELNGGTINDAAGNNATLTLPAPGSAGSLGANAALVVDTLPPSLAAAGLTSTTANGPYGAGAVITIQVPFTEVVNVNTSGGTPTLLLETGSTDRAATYSAGSGTKTLSFSYTVRDGDASSDLDAASSLALQPNGATIKDGAGNDAILTLPAPGTAGSLGDHAALVIDALAPSLASPGITSTTINDVYGIGSVITIRVPFTEVVTVNTSGGIPTLLLDTGILQGTAAYNSGSGTTTLSFSYTVKPGEVSADLDVISTTALRLNGATIKDGAGNNANLTLPAPGTAGSLGANAALVINADTPTVVSSGLTSSTANGTYGVGRVITILVPFNEIVIVNTSGGAPTLQLETGSTDRAALYSGGSGSNTLSFRYTVRSGDSAAVLEVTSSTALQLNGAVIGDVVANIANLTLPAPGTAGSLGANAALVIDGVEPALRSGGLTSSTANGTYGVGSVITIQVPFTKIVTVDASGGLPTLLLETGNTDREAIYSGGSGSNTLSFQYTVQSGDSADDLDVASASALQLNGATIRDVVGNNANISVPVPGTAGSLAANAALVIDGVQPALRSSGLTSSTSDGTYTVGTVITIRVPFTKVVIVDASGGLPTLLLETGSTDRNATYSGGSGTTILSFQYTVQSGDSAAVLDVVSTSALRLNGATIRDTAGNNANISVPVPGTAGSLAANATLVIDAVNPVVATAGLSSSNANGPYGAGSVITIRVPFSEVVNVNTSGGTPTLLLETGSTDRIATYISGSDSAILSFRYTVQPGDSSVDLDAASRTALQLNGGLIRDGAGNLANLSLPAPGGPGSLAANAALVIDGVAPTVAPGGLTSATSNGTYGVGQVITIQVPFTKVVSVVTTGGTPSLLLETGSIDRTAIYSGGSGSNTLSFRYTVQPGDSSADLDVASTTALQLNGATIRDALNNAANLTLPAPGSMGSLGSNAALVLDAVGPLVAFNGTGSLSSTNPNGSLGIGTVITVLVPFSEVVTVNTAAGTPTLLLETGSVDRTALYTSGSGTNTLRFQYMVQSGDSSADLDIKSTTALQLNGATIRDGIGNNANLFLPAPGSAGSLAAAGALMIDGSAPAVAIGGLISATSNGTYTAGRVITIRVPFTEAVTVNTSGGTPTLLLETGSIDTAAIYSGGSGTATLSFAYTVQAGDISADLEVASTTALQLNGASIRDGAGNNASLLVPAPGSAGSLGSNAVLVIDGVVPRVAAAGLLSLTANSRYGAGTAITLQVPFTENVVVNTSGGIPTLLLETGSIDRAAIYKGGSGSNTLSFQYTVQSGDNTTDLDAISTTALQLNGAIIRDKAGNSADVSLPQPGGAGSLAVNADLRIDPSLSAVATSGLTATFPYGSHGIGSVITIQVPFQESVTVNTSGGFPTLLLETGSIDRAAIYKGGSGSNTLSFEYTVQSGDVSSDLDVTASTALQLNGGTILDAAGLNADLTLPSPGGQGSLAANSALVIDGVTPQVPRVSSSSPNGTYAAGAVMSIQVAFSESVKVDTSDGTPTLLLETGNSDQTATYSGGSGSTILSFQYTVQPGDSSADLDVASTTALQLNGATIRDFAANNANLTLPEPGSADSLAGSAALVIDAVAPTLSSSNPVDNATGVSESANLQLSFSEPVRAGSDLIQLFRANGELIEVFDVATGLGSAGGTLAFAGTTLSLNPSADLASTSAYYLMIANSAIRDAVGNAYAGFSDATTLNFSTGDSKAPSVRDISSTMTNGTFGTGAQISITLRFSEVVNVNFSGGTPSLLLETGSTDRPATYISGSGSDTLTFSYTVQSGDRSLDLDLVSNTVLQLNGGIIRDAAGNSAALTLPAPGSAGSLGANAALVINGTNPQTLILNPASPTVNEGSNLSVKLSSSTLAPGATLYWSLSGSGITPADVNPSILDGSLVLGTDRSASFSTAITADGVVEGNEQLTLTVFSDPARTNTLAGAQIILRDINPIGLDGATDDRDVIVGTSGDDIVTGIPTGSLLNGKGSYDSLTGNGGNDIFVLGTASSVYYNDGVSASTGALDLAAITDFNAGDRIQLKGAATHYRLLTSTLGGASGTLLQWLASSGAGTVNESIGFIQGLNTGALSLTNSSQFLFVNPV